ncbi:ANTAR domain-containing protein [Streptomyces sp. RP5T]|uniref:ANTAR domain-containing protein n=1 Tax=Streptomyces sp. RP5T TaxID=2490848 RepID=UPI000F6549C1|nr:ANTAR domain-containing protein [Streptomyces sp. RP5T]RRR84930.1 ANTAR domain-containing protein [Streptomyces sp. RP5T]
MTQHEEPADKVEELRTEVAQLRQALVSHAIVDQAIGVVIALSGLRPEQGWEILKTVSQHTNTKVREVAGHVVRWPDAGTLPPEIRRALRAALVEAHTVHGGRSLVRPEQRCQGRDGAFSGKTE